MTGTIADVGGYKRMTVTANVSPIPASLFGVLCASTTAGTIQFYDDPATGTSTPITGVITPAAGAYVFIKASASKGIYAVIGGTLDCTVIWAP